MNIFVGLEGKQDGIVSKGAAQEVGFRCQNVCATQVVDGKPGNRPSFCPFECSPLIKKAKINEIWSSSYEVSHIEIGRYDPDADERD